MAKPTKKQSEFIALRTTGFVLAAEVLQDVAPFIELTEDEMIVLNNAKAEIPAKDLARLADLWRMTQSNRLAADKEADKLKQAETALQSVLIDQMRAQDISAIGGKEVIVEVTEDTVPTVTDWAKFHAYVLAEQDFSLLERRPGKAAIKERWEDGVQVPGVTKFPVYKLSRKQVKG